MKLGSYHTLPNKKQISFIYRLSLVSIPLEDIEDIILFSKAADANPILIDDVIDIYNKCIAGDQTRPFKIFELPESYKNLLIQSPYISITEASDALKLKLKNKKSNKTLEEIRTGLGLKRSDVSNDTFIEEMNIYQYEKGNRVIPFLNALILSHFYDKNLSDINWFLE